MRNMIVIMAVAAISTMWLPCMGTVPNEGSSTVEMICDTTQTPMSEYDRWIDKKSVSETEEYKHYKSGIIQKGSSILREGLEVIPPEGGQVVLFQMGGKIGVAFNRSDLFVLYEPQFEDAYNEDFSKSNGMVLLKRDGKWGALNTTARPGAGIADVTVPFVFDKLTPFRNGRSTATLNGKTFTIDTFGKRLD